MTMSKEYHRALRKTHKKQCAEYCKKYRLRTSGVSWRKGQMQKLYGLTESDYQSLLIRQNGLCAICKNKQKGKSRFHIDHNHDTNKIRGLLCTRCNLGIELLKDSIPLLTSAIDYLSMHIGDINGNN